MTLAVPLSDVVAIHYGSALKGATRVETGVFDVYGSGGLVGHHDEALTTNPTIIIGRKGSVGSITYAPKGGWAIDTAFYVELLDRNRVDLRYLFFALQRARLQQHTITTSIPGLSRDDIYRTRIPLPPLPEQRRIADILDKADAIRRKRREAIALTEELLRAAFLEMFGDPVTNPKGWQVLPFGDGPVEIIDGDRGAAYPKTEDFSPDGFCLFLNAGNVRKGGFDFSERMFVSRDKDEALRKGRLQRDDVVLTTRGTLGNTAYFDATVPYASVRINSGMVVLRSDQAQLNPAFLYYYLRSPHFRRQIDGIRSGSAQPQLPIRSLKNMTLLLPPFDDQGRFAQAFVAIDAHNALLRHSGRESETLFASLVRRAFHEEFAEC